MKYSDDSSGKDKIVVGKALNRSLIAYFIVGICIGLMVAERVYISKGGRVPKPRFLRTEHDLQPVMPDPHAPPRQMLFTQATAFLTAHAAAGRHVSTQDQDRFHYPLTSPPRNDLERVLREVAPTKEVLVAVSNKNIIWDGMLDTFCNGIKQAGITNHLIMALDKETVEWAGQHGIHAYFMDIQIHKTQQGTGDNHAVSAMKFGILKQVVELGWAVLLSDVDIAILQNPFQYLYRDSDVEGMTDGFDDPTAYGAIDGFDDPSMGWARFAQLYKHFNLNSGLFYLLANERTLNLLVRLETRLSKQKYWDQTAYNEEIFFLSHGAYKSPQVSVRVMEIDKFMNSKRLFKIVRNMPREQQPTKPVMVHINYHPDKHERMKAVFKYYVDGDSQALAPFPGGSERGTR